MKIEKIIEEPAIVDIYFDELENIDLDPIFNHEPGFRQDYKELVVYDGRKTIPNTSKEYSIVHNIINQPIIEIAKILLSLDKKRYPDFQIESLFQNCRLGILVTVDEPGFSQPWHLDNRFIVLSGVINAMDNTTQTHFATQNYHWVSNGTDFSTCDIIHKGQTKKYYGTAWLNTEITWHSVPLVTSQRKILLYNLFFY